MTLKCKLCSSEELTKLPYPCKGAQAPVERFKIDCILSCATCGYGEIFPMVEQSEIDRFYSDGHYWEKVTSNPLLDNHNQNQDRFRVRSIYRYFKARSVQDQSLTVLDIGAGSGNIANGLKKYFKDYDVEYNFIELDPHKAQNIINTHRSIKATLVELDSLKQDTYDIVFLNHVLEHVIDAEEFLLKVSKAVKKGGLIYIEVPNRDDKVKPNVFPHTLFFSERSLQHLGEKLKWHTIQTSSFGHEVFNNESKLLNLRGRLLSKAFYFLVSKKRFKLAQLIDILMFQYFKKNADGPWIKWISQK